MTTYAHSSLAQAADVLPNWQVWTGRIVSGLAVAFLLFDGLAKVVRAAPVLRASTQLGLSHDYTTGIGLVLVACTLLHVVPRTTVLGAVLLTGYLGGAAAMQLRADNGAFPVGFAIVTGVLVWVGLTLRDPHVLAWLFRRA